MHELARCLRKTRIFLSSGLVPADYGYNHGIRISCLYPDVKTTFLSPRAMGSVSIQVRQVGGVDVEPFLDRRMRMTGGCRGEKERRRDKIFEHTLQMFVLVLDIA